MKEMAPLLHRKEFTMQHLLSLIFLCKVGKQMNFIMAHLFEL